MSHLLCHVALNLPSRSRLRSSLSDFLPSALHDSSLSATAHSLLLKSTWRRSVCLVTDYTVYISSKTGHIYFDNHTMPGYYSVELSPQWTLKFLKTFFLGHYNIGVAKEGPGTPNPIPLKLLRIKRVRTTHALRIRLIELNNLHNIVHRILPNEKFCLRPCTINSCNL